MVFSVAMVSGGCQQPLQEQHLWKSESQLPRNMAPGFKNKVMTAAPAACTGSPLMLNITTRHPITSWGSWLDLFPVPEIVLIFLYTSLDILGGKYSKPLKAALVVKYVVKTGHGNLANNSKTLQEFKA